MAVAVLTPLGVGLSLDATSAQTPINRATDLRSYAYSAAFDDVDFSEIEERARQRDLEVDEGRLSDFVRRNFSYVFWHCLDQRRFLSPPPPKRVAESIVKVLDLNQRLTSLLAEARRVASIPWSPGGLQESSGRRLMHEVGEAARDLKSAFQGSFVEVHKTRYKVAVPSSREERGRFMAFLVQAERINRSLTGKVDEYFFSSDPGAVKVADFEEASVVVLAEALSKLSDMSAKPGRR